MHEEVIGFRALTIAAAARVPFVERSLRAARAFPGKVDTGFPKGNATNIESRALSVYGACSFMVNLNGKRSSGTMRGQSKSLPAKTFMPEIHPLSSRASPGYAVAHLP
jgi:hypothetical protein